MESISNSKRQFIKLIEEKYGQKEIPFPEFEKLDAIDKSSDINKNLKKALNYDPKRNILY
jgi:flagellin-specific chaperone FliS